MKIDLNKFVVYCETPGVASGKGKSYAKAIEYLCNYLQIDLLNFDRINDLNKIKVCVNSLKSNNSLIYKDFYQFLDAKSYLTGGFVQAAIPYFEKFI